MARVALRKNLARAVLSGHPWLYRDALRAPPALPDGALVLVTTGDGRPLGRGFWTASTPIAVRMLTTDPTDDIALLVRHRLEAALARRLGFLELARTNAFRWVHGEADGLPGIHLDLYAGLGSVRFDGPGARAFYRDFAPVAVEVAAAAAAAPPLSMRALIERRSGGRSGARNGEPRARADAQTDGAATALVGELPRGEVEVRENDLVFGVDLVLGQKGGLFLDQRDNRQRVRELSAGRRVLNLFGYTGGFSVYAASGGAAATTTVDISGGAILAGRENFRRNGLPSAGTAAARFVAGDVFEFLAGATRDHDRDRFDLVVSDPPSFAPSRRALPEALRAYVRLHRLCAEVLEPGGLLCAASCSSHVGEGAFIATITAGCAAAGRRFELLEVRGAGADHPVSESFPEGRYLKFVVGVVT